MNVLEVQGLTKAFGGLIAVDQFDLSLEKGDLTAIIGPNGSGKTTLFNLVTGFLSTDDGRVFLRDRDITNQPPHKINHLGLVRSFQEVRIFRNMPVLDNVLVAFGRQKGENLGWLFFHPWKLAQEEKENMRLALAYLDVVGLR